MLPARLAPNEHNLTFACVHCGREQQVRVHVGMGVYVGMVIKPYRGGGRWGTCLFCKKSGLRAIEALPPKRIEPVGWKLRPSNESLYTKMAPKSGAAE